MSSSPAFVAHAVRAIEEHKAAAATALVLTLLVLYLLWDAGVLQPVKLQTKVLGPFLILYKDVVGPYHLCGKIQMGVVDAAVKLGLIHSSQACSVPKVGAFFDDPALVPPDQLRHSVGCAYKMGAELATPQDVARYRSVLEALTLVKQGELKVGFIPAVPCLAARMPFRGLLSMTVSIMRAYPRLQRQLRQEVKAGRTSDAVVKVVGSLEVYLGAERCMWISFPLAARGEVTGFDPSTTLVNHYTGSNKVAGAAAGGGGAAGAKKHE